MERTATCEGLQLGKSGPGPAGFDRSAQLTGHFQNLGGGPFESIGNRFHRFGSRSKIEQVSLLLVGPAPGVLFLSHVNFCPSPSAPFRQGSPSNSQTCKC